MTSKVYEFTGLAYYAKLFGKGDEKYKRWSLGLILEPSSQNLFDKSGIQLEQRKTPDGQVYYNFARPFAKLIKDKLQNFAPIEVTNATGQTGDYGEDNLIGNGSRLRVHVSVYDSIKGLGHRLESVQVLKHVPYESQKVITPDDLDELPF